MSGAEPKPGSLAWMRELAASRRFGDRDRRGTANLIDDQARQRACTSIRTGEAVSLGRPLTGGDSFRDDGRPTFSLQRFRAPRGEYVVGSDHIELDCHGLASTHLDGFNHFGLDGTWYSGWPLEDMDACAVDEFAAKPILTRGVIADIPAARGTDWVEPSAPVGGDDIECALEIADVKFTSGDALLLYMGRDRFESFHGPDMPYVYDRTSDDSSPGAGGGAAAWIADHGASVLAWDFADAKHPDESHAPVHGLMWALGLVVVDNCDFSRLIPIVRQSGQAVGAFAVAPLLILGATGCNVNPLLII